MSTIFIRDMRLAFRSGGGFGLSLAFFLIVACLIPFGSNRIVSKMVETVPGMFWIAVLFACLLSLDRVFQSDFEDGTLERLAISDIPMEGLAVAKIAANWVATAAPLCVAAPVASALVGLPPATSWWLFASMLVGTPAVCAVGAFGAAATISVKRGGLLFPVLALPFCIPTLIFGTSLTESAAGGDPVAQPLLALAGISLATAALIPFATARMLQYNLV